MIQRKQTLFLLAAVIVLAVCLFLPIGGILPNGMGGEDLLYNLGIVMGEGGISFDATCLPLFVLLSVSVVLSLVNVFMYKNRKLQMSLCSVSMLFSLLWYVDYALLFFGIIPLESMEGSLEVKFASCLPFIAIILVAMAKRGISDDEKLVKAADRIR